MPFEFLIHMFPFNLHVPAIYASSLWHLFISFCLFFVNTSQKITSRARRDIGRYKASRWAAESELSNAHKTVKDLSSMIEESSYMAKAQMTKEVGEGKQE